MYLPFRGSQTTIWLLGSKPRVCQYVYSRASLCKLTLEGEVVDLEALVGALGGRNDGGVANERVVNSGVGDQVGLELVEINVEGTVESQRRGDGADDLGDQAVEVLVRRSGNIEVSAANVVDGLVVDEEGAVGVLNGAVSRQNGVVGLNDGSGNTRSRVDGELELRLLAVLGRQTLEEERAETGTGTTAKRVEDQEALEGVAVVFWGGLSVSQAQRGSQNKLTNNAAHAVHDIVNHLLANCVVTTGVVVGGILLAADQELGVEELAVVAGADLVDGRRVQVDEDGTRDMLPAASLGEEGLEGTGVANIRAAGVGAAIGTEAVLEEVAVMVCTVSAFPKRDSAASRQSEGGSNVQLPGGVTELGTSLAQVEVKNLYRGMSTTSVKALAQPRCQMEGREE